MDPLNASVDTQQLDQKLRRQDSEQHFQRPEQKNNSGLNQFPVRQAMSPRKKELLQKIKDKQLQRIQRTRLSEKAKIQLQNIRHHIYSKAEGFKDTRQINFQSYLADQHQPKLNFSSQHGVLYFNKLKPILKITDFLDQQIIKNLCNEQIGRERAIVLNYYIDWMFVCKYERTFFKLVKSYWQDLKTTLKKIFDKICTSVCGFAFQIGQLLQAAWKTMFL